MVLVAAITAVWRAVCSVLIFLYVVAPIFLLLFPNIHLSFLFMNFIKWPFNDFSDLESAGVEHLGRNFYVESEPGVTLGVWQILPKTLSHAHRGKQPDFDALLADDRFPLIVYLHGNGFSRMSPHRVELYNVLAENDYHTLAFDYRGYGDSSGTPTEAGVVTDGLFIWNWLRARVGPSRPVILWGHSLGTAIGTKVARALCLRGQCPAGVVLESPFNNLTQILRHVPMTRAFRWLPFFDRIMIRPCIEILRIDLDTDRAIRDVSVPILILHAEEDWVVPLHLGVRLFEDARAAGKDVELITFDEVHDYGHKYVCRAPELPEILRKFTKKCFKR